MLKLTKFTLLMALITIIGYPLRVWATPLAPDTDLSEADTIFLAESPGDEVGTAVTGLGDVNGDGLLDFAIGAPGNSEYFLRGGQVYLFFGRPGGWGSVLSLAQADASFIGERMNAKAGESVTSAGDVNNDGYDDILIAAPMDTEAGLNAGQVYLILGKDEGWEKDTALSQSDASFIGENPSDQAGTSLAGVEDVNGDGFDDILIGAPFNSYSGNRAGQAYLVLGKEAGWVMDVSLSLSDASFTGEESLVDAGNSLSGAGDVNGDGINDLLIGSWMSDRGDIPNTGEAYLVFGKETGWTMRTPLADSDASFIGENLGHWAGFSVAGAGNVNGDNFDDILVGAPGNDDHGRQTGEVYVILGKASNWMMHIPLETADASYITEWWGYTWTGSLVSKAGDINQDGLDDFLVAGFIDEEGGLNAGQIHLILGRMTDWNQNTDLIDVVSFFGEDAGDFAGSSIAWVGDVNNDGLDDILIGAPRNSSGGQSSGRAYLILGNKGPSAGQFNPDLPFKRAGFYHNFTTSYYDVVDGWNDLRVVSLKGTSIDGLTLMLVYQPKMERLWLRENNTGWIGPCRRGQPGSLTGTYFEMDCEKTTSSNDGGSKLEVNWRIRLIQPIFSRRRLNFTLQAQDSAHNVSPPKIAGVWSIGPDRNVFDLSQANDSFLGENAWDLAGWSVTSAGDVNNDGLEDILIGAPSNQEFTPVGGQTYLVFGDPEGWGTNIPLTEADASFTGEGEYSYSGYAISGVGDVNKDGYDDFVIGAYGNREVGDIGGQVYLIFGKASGWTMDTSLSQADASFISAGSELVGWSVTGAGDVNKDGYDDFLIGAIGFRSDIGPLTGAVFLILGKSSGWMMDSNLSQADASFIGESSSSWAGFTVAGVGDINNDGFDDFMIGAPSNDESGLESGQAYIILGKATGWFIGTSLSQADASILGEPNDQVGRTLGGVGDVNDDGFDDFLITAWGTSGGVGREAGQIFLFLGHQDGWHKDMPLTAADASFLGERDYDRAGASLSLVGDINQDSYDDFAIGAPKNDDAGNEAGKVYIILGRSEGWVMGESLTNAVITLWGEDPGDRAGNSLTGLSHAIGHNSIGLLIGAPGRNMNEIHNMGKIYFVTLPGIVE